MKTSTTTKSIAPDLVKALGELKAIRKDAQNPFLKNKYASLDSIIEGTKDILAKHNLCIMQAVSEEGIETTIMHTSGESISSGTMSIPVEISKGLSAAQARGVAITYCKRYQLGSLLGVSTDEDTDGQYHDNKGLEKPTIPATPSRVAYPAEKFKALIAYMQSHTLEESQNTYEERRKSYIFTPAQENQIALTIKSKEETK